MKFGIIGNGVVGQATARAWIEHVKEVRVWDIKPEKRSHSLGDVLNCDYVFICLPTPKKDTGYDCDTSTIEHFLKGTMRGYIYPLSTIFVIRSTVPVGFTSKLAKETGLRLIHNPEFLTARCANTDAHLPSRNVLGYTKGLYYDRLIGAYQLRFPGVPLFVGTSEESEAIKLFTNSFFAIKVAAFNEFYTFAQKLGMDWQLVHAAIMADGRIAHSHTQVPGPDGLRGFGGTCLPKDLANLIHCMDSLDLLTDVCTAALERNAFDRLAEVNG